ncbi:Prostaglandin E synthase 3 [Armadillidium vulgare]|nr:Prostaglandin E synthase 3 [Armadillidium vulgare]
MFKEYSSFKISFNFKKIINPKNFLLNNITVIVFLFEFKIFKVFYHFNRALPPPVTWAQRKNVVFLTFCVEDCKNPEIKMEADKIYFKGVGGSEKKNYENTLELYKEIDAEKSRHFVRDRVIELILVKKEEGPYWPQLLKQKIKMHWLKVDFTKWKDENDSDDEGTNNPDLESVSTALLLLLLFNLIISKYFYKEHLLAYENLIFACTWKLYFCNLTLYRYQKI